MKVHYCILCSKRTIHGDADGFIASNYGGYLAGIYMNAIVVAKK